MPSSSSSSEANNNNEETESTRSSKLKKQGLGWIEWLRGWFYIAYEMLFQRIMASHLQNPMPLPPLNDLTCIITGSTSGIGRETARSSSSHFLRLFLPFFYCSIFRVFYIEFVYIFTVTL